MTRNNLRDHLAWLLRASPTVAPLLASPQIPHVTTTIAIEPISILAAESSSVTRQAPTSYTDDPSPDSDSGIEIISNGSETKRDFEFVRPLLPDKTLRGVDDMARLQSASKANRKQLLFSHATSETVSTGSEQRVHREGSSLQDQYVARLERKRAGPPKDVSPLKKKQSTKSRIGGNTESDQHASSSSTVDAFAESRILWREDSASRIEPLPESAETQVLWKEDSALRTAPTTKKSKKRKSDEMESADRLDDRTPHATQDSFVSIEDYGFSPPLKKKTQAERRKALTAQSPQASNVFENTLVTDKTPPPSQKRHNDVVSPMVQSLQRPISPIFSQSIPAASYTPKPKGKVVIASPPKSRSPQKQRSQKRRVIQDSEDDDVDVDDEVEICEASSSFRNSVPKQEPGLHDTTRLPPEPVTMQRSDSGNAHRIGYKSSNASPNSQAKRAILSEVKSSASPYQKDSPTKGSPSKNKEDPPPSSGNILVEPQKVAVKSYLQTKPIHTQMYLDDLYGERETLARRAHDLVMKGGPINDWRRMESDTGSLTLRISLTKGLQQQRGQYEAIKEKVKTLQENLKAAWAQEEYPEELATEQAKASRQLKSIESRIAALLDQQSSIQSFETNFEPRQAISIAGERGSGRETVMVKSTQAHNVLAPPDPAFKESTNSSHTNVVELTPKYSERSVRVQRDRAEEKIERRKALNTFEAETRNVPPSPIRIRSQIQDAPPRPTGVERSDSHVASKQRYQHFMEDQAPPPMMPYEDEESFSNDMGGLLQHYDSPDDDYGAEEEDFLGDDEDDFDMLEAANRAEMPRNRTPFKQTSRTAFSETSGNIQRQATKTVTPLKDQMTPAQLRLPWSADVKFALKDKFHLRGFRPNQLEAINATLSGKDAFVLMPTGGGKSLCYQLPAIVGSGKTEGVTIVVSPLLSLMQDQVQHLSDLGIQAFLFSGDTSPERRRMITDALQENEPQRYIQLLYITPEMISKSGKMGSAFQDLHRREKLARIVIDEAHCVSQWGHDFRPDYKAIGEVRSKIPGVPMMALTATATENVRVDVIHNLKMQGCETFTQSFNRPNLFYEVRRKGKAADVLEEVVDLVKYKHRGQSGIIYCLSRRNCEDVAQKLREVHGIRAHHYHAQIDAAEKAEVQQRWQKGQYQVIVATIAFGMGIDKPDVRFVIHYTVPKSLEGYYQETGRAGRDGKRSDCYLYFGYQDIGMLQRMIDDGEGPREQKQRLREMLRMTIQFCENRSDCRRVQILNYFGESFKSDDCQGACDNCNSTSTFEMKDFTAEAITVLNLVDTIAEHAPTMAQCIDVMRGAQSKKILDMRYNDLDQHGAGKHMDRGSVERMFYRLLSDDALKEITKLNAGGFPMQHVQLGANSRAYTHGRRRLNFHVSTSPKPKPQAKKKPKQAKSRADFPLSTHLSSPARAKSRRKNKLPDDDEEDAFNDIAGPGGYEDDGFVVADNGVEPESEDADFPPPRVAGKRLARTKPALGPPITIDQKMESLDDMHRIVVDNFVGEAEKLAKRIAREKGLKNQIFTTTILREMAVTFPKDTQNLLRIPNIKPEHVASYGKKFLQLIHNAEQMYLDMRGQGEVVPDPNHEEVIVISDDGGDKQGAELDFSDDDLDCQEGETSSYFKQQPADVQRFNEQMSQAPAVAPSARRREEPPSDNKKTYNKGGRSGYKSGYKRGSKGKASASGSYKKGRQSNLFAKAPRGGGDGGGFAMMPT